MLCLVKCVFKSIIVLSNLDSFAGPKFPSIQKEKGISG